MICHFFHRSAHSIAQRPSSRSKFWEIDKTKRKQQQNMKQKPSTLIRHSSGRDFHSWLLSSHQICPERKPDRQTNKASVFSARRRRMIWSRHFVFLFFFKPIDRCCKGFVVYGGLQRSVGDEPHCLGFKKSLENVEVTEEDVGECTCIWLDSTRARYRLWSLFFFCLLFSVVDLLLR